jgi:uncharacterized protein YndB with AHSA1/START domain
MAEVPLPGGNTTGAVLIDDVIHKPASLWTPTVHALLRYLEEAGFPGAPRALGFDSSGREMLSYLPGETIGDRMPWPAWASADSMLVQVGQWLRRLHDLTADFRPPADERWFIGGVMRPGLIVGHQDPAPYNAVVDGERLVGFYDWDIAGPSSREWDLAFSMPPGCRSRRPRRVHRTRRVHRPRPVRAGRMPASGRGGSICCSTRTASRVTVRCSGRWCRSEPGDRPGSSGARPRLAIRRPSRSCRSLACWSPPRSMSKRFRATSGCADHPRPLIRGPVQSGLWISTKPNPAQQRGSRGSLFGRRVTAQTQRHHP